ncbi:hypothetical protein GCM10009640_01760 [Agrococcus citreus]|uniref:Uncharacterized protein n=1 Tax=Agrococcus citreus TaxID=84643 RepID=A0ABN1YLS3_9MICO
MSSAAGAALQPASRAIAAAADTVRRRARDMEVLQFEEGDPRRADATVVRQA